MATNVVQGCKEGGNACVVHPSGILGPEDFAMVRPQRLWLISSMVRCPPELTRSFNLCDVNLADGLIGAADKGKGECYILGMAQSALTDFKKFVSEESGCKQMKFFYLASAANFIAKILGEKKPKRWRKSSYNFPF
ncbi:hypothetical protein [Butyrivibrio fibrisolvens]|uniref:hypothetical protein n=1 Tax=Butyrivibrio fibrisolvens TaxID=831 RepID=UPI0020C12864|nr:hypothetical protein [Butyrivibrio fibrisolvens]